MRLSSLNSNLVFKVSIGKYCLKFLKDNKDKTHVFFQIEDTDDNSIKIKYRIKTKNVSLFRDHIRKVREDPAKFKKARMFSDFPNMNYDSTLSEDGPTNNALTRLDGKERRLILRRQKSRKGFDNNDVLNLTTEDNVGHTGRDYHEGEDGYADFLGGREEEGGRANRKELGDFSLDRSDNPQENGTDYNHENPSFSPNTQEIDDKLKHRQYRLKLKRQRDSDYPNYVKVYEPKKRKFVNKKV